MQTIQSADDIDAIMIDFCGGYCQIIPLFILSRELNQSIECAQYDERLPFRYSPRGGCKPDMRDIRRLHEFCDLCDMLAGVGCQ